MNHLDDSRSRLRAAVAHAEAVLAERAADSDLTTQLAAAVDVAEARRSLSREVSTSRLSRGALIAEALAGLIPETAEHAAEAEPDAVPEAPEPVVEPVPGPLPDPALVALFGATPTPDPDAVPAL